MKDFVMKARTLNEAMCYEQKQKLLKGLCTTHIDDSLYTVKKE